MVIMKLIFLVIFVSMCASEATAKQQPWELLPSLTFCRGKPSGDYVNVNDIDGTTYIKCKFSVPVLLPCLSIYNEKHICNSRTTTIKPTTITAAPTTAGITTESPTSAPTTTDAPTTVSTAPTTTDFIIVTVDDTVTDAATEDSTTDVPNTESPTTELATDNTTEETTITTQETTISTDEPSTTTIQQSNEIKCPSLEYEWIPYPEDCKLFYICYYGFPNLAACQEHEYFSKTKKMCLPRYLVQCDIV